MHNGCGVSHRTTSVVAKHGLNCAFQNKTEYALVRVEEFYHFGLQLAKAVPTVPSLCSSTGTMLALVRAALHLSVAHFSRFGP